MNVAIEFDEVDKSYSRNSVLKRLSFVVPERSVFAFLGNNGHGKSTTIRLIAGLASADSGSIRIFGSDIARAPREILRHTGFLIEAPSVYPNLTSAEYLSIGVTLKRLPRSEIDRTLQLVGLHRNDRRRIEHYSLGMKQRLALAHALLGNPRLLVLDEPTNGLDPNGIQDIRRLLSTLPESTGCTIFFASHHLDEVEKTATHIAVLHEGSIRAQAAVNELTTRITNDLALEVDDASKAAEVLSAHGFPVVVSSGKELCIPAIEPDRACVVNGLLVRSGIALHQSTLRRSTLEEWFLQTISLHKSRA